MDAIKTVSIVGVGLIGGSFALALRRIGYHGTILGVSSPSTLSRALDLGVIDEASTLDAALPRSDLVYMAQPVLRIIEDLGRTRQLVPDHALVTDAGSTKLAIVERARELFSDGPDFLGGHPMAGREGRGVESAQADLFEGATYVLVPTGEHLPDSPVANEFGVVLDAMGCRRKVMRPGDHDRIVGWTSHMPQLVSTALAAAICEGLAEPGDLAIAGDGLRDMTRLAASSHEVWADILRTNQGAIDEALGTFISEMESLRRALSADAAEKHFERGRNLRARLSEP